MFSFAYLGGDFTELIWSAMPDKLTSSSAENIFAGMYRNRWKGAGVTSSVYSCLDMSTS